MRIFLYKLFFSLQDFFFFSSAENIPMTSKYIFVYFTCLFKNGLRERLPLTLLCIDEDLVKYLEIVLGVPVQKYENTWNTKIFFYLSDSSFCFVLLEQNWQIVILENSWFLKSKPKSSVGFYLRSHLWGTLTNKRLLNFIFADELYWKYVEDKVFQSHIWFYSCPLFCQFDLCVE